MTSTTTTTTTTTTPAPPAGRRSAPPGSSSVGAAISWGLAGGVAVALTPVAFWWLAPTTVYAVGVIVSAAVYLGLAVADGRRHVLAVESTVVAGFVMLSALAMVSSPWLVAGGFLAHACKDLWQHRTGFVANTLWWPPFCATVDVVAALVIAGLMVTRTHLG